MTLKKRSFFNAITRRAVFWYYLPILIWASLIFFLSHQPVLPGHTVFQLDFVIKKSGHIFVYAVLFFLIYRALVYNKLTTIQGTIICLLISCTYALSDELHQSFIPGRTASLRDVLFDCLGMMLAWLKIHDYI